MIHRNTFDINPVSGSGSGGNTDSLAKQEPTPESDGHKHDTGKLRWSLLPFKALAQVVRVLMFGADKYSERGWQNVPDAERRYGDALIRHVTDYLAGETYDPESGLHHLAHAACNCLFIMWFGGYKDVRDH